MKTKVLIVEDEPLVALELETTLKAAGFEVTGVAASSRSALDFIDARDFDVAILDARLRDEISAPVVTAAQRAAKPYLLVSGYNRDFLPTVFHQAPLIAKPFDPDHLIKAVRDLLTTTNPFPA